MVSHPPLRVPDTNDSIGADAPLRHLSAVQPRATDGDESEYALLADSVASVPPKNLADQPPFDAHDTLQLHPDAPRPLIEEAYWLLVSDAPSQNGGAFDAPRIAELNRAYAALVHDETLPLNNKPRSSAIAATGETPKRERWRFGVLRAARGADQTPKRTDHYRTLFVARHAEPSIIALAAQLLTRNASRRDVDSIERIAMIEEARATLADPVRRAEYDASLKGPRQVQKNAPLPLRFEKSKPAVVASKPILTSKTDALHSDAAAHATAKTPTAAELPPAKRQRDRRVVPQSDALAAERRIVEAARAANAAPSPPSVPKSKPEPPALQTETSGHESAAPTSEQPIADEVLSASQVEPSPPSAPIADPEPQAAEPTADPPEPAILDDAAATVDPPELASPPAYVARPGFHAIERAMALVPPPAASGAEEEEGVVEKLRRLAGTQNCETGTEPKLKTLHNADEVPESDPIDEVARIGLVRRWLNRTPSGGDAASSVSSDAPAGAPRGKQAIIGAEHARLMSLRDALFAPIETPPTADDAPKTRVRATLTFVAGSNTGKQVPLDDEAVTLGSASNAAVVLPPSEGIAAEHARIWQHGEHFVLRHADGARTTIGGEPLSLQLVVLDDGDEIGIGEHRIRFNEVPASTGARVPLSRIGGMISTPSTARGRESDPQAGTTP